MVGYCLDQWGLIPGRSRDFTLRHYIHSGSGVHSVSCLMAVGEQSYWNVKLTPPFCLVLSVRLGSLTFTPPMHSYVVVPRHRELFFPFYFCLIRMLRMSWIQCSLVRKLPEWRLATWICFNGQFICRRYDRWNIRSIRCGGMSNIRTCIQQGRWLLFVNDIILVFDFIEDNDVCGCHRRRRGSDVSQGQASNTKGRSCPMLSRISRTYWNAVQIICIFHGWMNWTGPRLLPFDRTHWHISNALEVLGSNFGRDIGYRDRVSSSFASCSKQM
jgi:hypothetical protein